MKYCIITCLLALFLSCNDGDLSIAPVDFDAAALEFCDTEVTTGTSLFFKLNEENALIVELQDGLLLNEESTDSLVSTVPAQSQVTYRIFSDKVERGYFCDAVPTTTPGVVEDIPAQAGELIVKSIQSATDTTVYEHTLSLLNLTLINSKGERLTNLNTIELGTVNTKIN